MTAKTMLAARLRAVGEPLTIEAIAAPAPGPDEILVAVAACGLCGTDIHLAVEGDIPVARKPITLGHEAAGTVVALGPGTGGFAVGQRVALFPSAICGKCRFCRAGRESLCEASQVYGMSRDGALAQYVAAPAIGAIPIPDGVDFLTAAIITDGVSTPFHALRTRGRLQAGEAVAVVGCGGLGAHAILLARMMGAGFIAAIDMQPEARARAAEFGADLVIDPVAEPDPVRPIRRRLGRGVDLALEFVGLPQTVEATLRCLDTGGRAVVVGVGPGRPVLPPLISFVGREQTLMGSFGMDKRDISDLFDLVMRGRLDLSRSVSGTYPLAGVNEALGRLARRDTGVVRLVIEPGQ
ncbi:alcohol dehydrogenase, propanol-preferring [Rhizobiaceae bacterium]|nr:alcohol dehydrogenase, propanol-preferring [Rhizobiaceae bacterium]